MYIFSSYNSVIICIDSLFRFILVIDSYYYEYFVQIPHPYVFITKSERSYSTILVSVSGEEIVLKTSHELETYSILYISKIEYIIKRNIQNLV